MIDTIIIGAGISGLYLGYRLKQHNIKFVILEKNNRIGGRIKVEKFHDVNINLGAGIFLETHDNLINLLKELKIEYNTAEAEYTFLNNNSDIDLDKIINTVEQEINKYYNETLPNINFTEFMNIYLSEDIIKLIKVYCIYDEHWFMNIHTVMKKYTITDIFGKRERKFCYIKKTWNALLDKLHDFIKDDIIFDNTVTSIEKSNHHEVTTTKQKLVSKNVIICTDGNAKDIKMTGINKLFIYILKNIIPQSSLRIYVKHKKYIIKNYLRTEKLLFKLVPISDEVTLVCYNDDVKADLINNLVKFNKEMLETLVNNTFNINLEISDVKISYWSNAVNYIDPRVNPDLLSFYNVNRGNLYKEHQFSLVGEFVNDYEYGYVENSIDSVNKFVKDIFTK